jgi:hypothetical protein
VVVNGSVGVEYVVSVGIVVVKVVVSKELDEVTVATVASIVTVVNDPKLFTVVVVYSIWRSTSPKLGEALPSRKSKKPSILPSCWAIRLESQSP